MAFKKAGNTLADFQYQFNSVNNITQMIDGAGSHNYTYDTRDRLTAATHPNQTNENYTLDDVGNRTASHQGSSYAYQAFNRLTTANSNSYGYDANGNLNSKTGASGTWTYTWDYENRLKQASLSGGVTVNNSFDGLGRRVQHTSSTGGTTKFVYDGADVLRDLDGSGSTIADYLNAPGIDNKLRQTTSGTASYFITDHLGTTRALTDATGSLASTFAYDSFGNVIGGAAPSRYTYTGREFDSDTGLLYYRARWYDPQLGRFISEDPIGLRGGINMYSYVENKVLNFKDPTGQDLFGVTGGGTAGGAVGGLGIIGTGGYLMGYNTNCGCEGETSIGGAGNIGISAGGYGYPSNRDNSGGLGATAGVGGGLFWSNAPSYSALSGTFQTTIISAFGFALEIDKSGPTIVGSLTFGKGWGGGIFHLTTNTPERSTWDTKCTRTPTIVL